MGIALVLGSADTHGLFSATTASWVQAVGAVGVIAGASWIAGRQSREAADREERRRLDQKQEAVEALEARREIALTLLEQAVGRAKSIAKKCQANGVARVNPFSIRALHIACASVSRFDVESLRQPRLIALFGRAEGALYIIVDFIEQRGDLTAKLTSDEEKCALTLELGKHIDTATDQVESLIGKFRAVTPGP